MTQILKLWLISAIVTICLSGLVYVTNLQIYRQTANDPQIQLAQDAADAIEAGRSAQSVIPPTQVNIAKSLAPFVIVLNEQGQPLASNADLDGRTPAIPIGVLETAKTNGSHRITWEPQTNLRIATVIEYFTATESGYVLAGRSLREVEARIELLNQTVAIALMAILITTLLVAFAIHFSTKKQG